MAESKTKMSKRRTNLHLTLVSPAKYSMFIIKGRNILLLTSSSTKVALFYISALEVLEECKLALLSHQILLHIYFLSIFPHLQFQSRLMLFCTS